MQRLIGLFRRVRERPPFGSASAPCAAGASELRGKGRGGLHSAAASGDLGQLQRRWWWKRLRINGRDAKNQTPLHLACANGHADVVRFLVGRKCQLNPRDNFKKSPLLKAVEHQHKDCVAILLEHGANPDLRDAGGNTALHLAAVIPSKSLVELLLEHNAHIDAQNELALTPLTVAITQHCEEMVEFLLQKGADVHARDKNGRTTLMVAVLAGNMNVIQLLLRHGADLSHEDQFGHTAMYYASLSSYTDIRNQLEEYVSCERTRRSTTGHPEGPAVLDRSCSETTADYTLGGPALTGAYKILRYKGGVLPAARAEQKEDFDSPSNSKTDSEGPRRASASVLLPVADGHGACVQSIAKQRGIGVLPAAGAGQEEDDDSPFDSETDSEGPRKASASVLLPVADGHGACVQSIAKQRGIGVLPAAGAGQEEDDDSPFDSETDSEGPRKASASVLLPVADGHGACVQSIAKQRGIGVLPAAGAGQEEDDDSPFDSETDSEGPRKASASVLLPVADGHGACVQSIAKQRGIGVLPAAGAGQGEDDDSPFDSETDSEGPRKASASVLLPVADGHGACVQSIAKQRSIGVLPAAGAGQEEDDDSPFDSEVSALGREELQLKKDASTQADCRGDRQRWVRQLQQKLANALKKNSVAEASLEAKKHYSRDLQEQKLQLQKELDKSKAKLQELKERHIRTEHYAESLKTAMKNKERELTTSRNLQGLLAVSSGTAAIPELEERIQRLQVEKARLEATAQQQAKTIEAFQKHLQASASARNGLQDFITAFQTTRTTKENQHQQHGSESNDLKQLAKLKCRSEALLDEMQGRNVALEEEHTRLKMLLERSQIKLMVYAGRERESQLSVRGEMKNSCSEVANKVRKLRRKCCSRRGSGEEPSRSRSGQAAVEDASYGGPPDPSPISSNGKR